MTTDRWWVSAKCRGINTDLFDTDKIDEESASIVIGTYCGNCPVREICLEDAVRIESKMPLNERGSRLYYIRGGKTPDERLTMLRRNLWSS